MVEDLIEVKRYDALESKLDLEEVNLNAVVLECFEQIAPKAEANRWLEKFRAYKVPDLRTSKDLWNDLAELVDLSPHHLCRSFKQATGTSPYQYILKERIERSKALLRMGNTSVAQVALSVGFSSQSHFADAFRKHTSTTPGRFLRHSSL